MRFNMKPYMDGKEIDLNPAQIVTRSITPIKNALDKDMKLVPRVAGEGETPDSYTASVTTSNVNIMFSFSFQTKDEAVKCLRSFKEDL